MQGSSPEPQSPISKSRSRAMRRAVVLEKAREMVTFSRTQMAAETGLSASTITHVVRQLMQEGVLCEIGSGESRGGRRTTLLRFQDAAELVGFVELKGRGMTLAFAGWHGEVVREMPLPSRIDSIAQAITAVRGELPGTLKAICLAVPGTPSASDDGVGLAPALRELAGGSLAELRESLDVPVVVDNDANLILAGEHAAGIGADHGDVALVHVADEGIGAALMLDGEVRTGAHGSAGEVGFFPLAAGAFHQGDSGAFEAAWSVQAVWRALSAVAPGAGSRDESLATALLREAPQNERVAALLQEAIDAWARAIVGIVCLIDPALVILSGELAAEKDFVRLLEDRVGRYWPKPVSLTPGGTANAMLLGGVRRGFAAAYKDVHIFANRITQ